MIRCFTKTNFQLQRVPSKPTGKRNMQKKMKIVTRWAVAMIILMTEVFVHNCTLSDCNASYLYNIELNVRATNDIIVYTLMITYNARFYSSRCVCPPLLTLKVPNCPIISATPKTTQSIILETFGTKLSQDDLNTLEDGKQLNDQMLTETQWIIY